jgi:DivIVA domain-containing protein
VSTPEPRAAQQLRATDITGQRFAFIRRGLDPDEVYEFLQNVADQISGLQGEVEWLRARGEHLERRDSSAQEAAYTRLSRVFEGVVRRADEAAARVRIGTEEEARVRVQAAREEADRIVLAAREESGRLIRVAREESDWLREQAAENVERAKRMASGVHPSMPRATTPPPPPEKPLAEIWASNEKPGTERAAKPEDFDLRLDASLSDLFGEAD